MKRRPLPLAGEGAPMIGARTRVRVRVRVLEGNGDLDLRARWGSLMELRGLASLARRRGFIVEWRWRRRRGVSRDQRLRFTVTSFDAFLCFGFPNARRRRKGEWL